ncbi:hypothetical protein ABZ863_25250 [Saccharomonospora sp. NPDC046836]|uniref:hypothetical protein n=1 Tax=Saccharomonospora sp. NPDC046836 TaxID=3156921 RepID=UPI00340E7FA2
MRIPLWTRIGLIVAVTGLMALAAVPAAAHPFGPPATATLTAEGDRLALSWQPAEDDWVALGRWLGAFEDPADAPVSTELTGEQKLQRSPAVRDYLLREISVRQQGRPCQGQLEELTELVARGARLVFDCPEPVAEVEVTITALHELNEAYRTVLSSTGANPAQVLYSTATPTQRLDFSAGGGGGSGQLLAVAIGTAAAIALTVLLLVRRTDRKTRTQ